MTVHAFISTINEYCLNNQKNEHNDHTCKSFLQVSQTLRYTRLMTVYHPPFRFAIVEHQVYRGAYPKERNYPYLKRLRLKTILSLTPAPPGDSVLSFGAVNLIQNLHVPVDKPKDNIPLTFTQVVKIVQIILDQQNLPIYIHCFDGTVVTGMVIACLRKLQYWTNSMALTEYARFISDDGDALPDADETEFVEKFQTGFEVHLTQPPPWFIIPSNTLHKTLRLKRIQSVSSQRNPHEPAQVESLEKLQLSLEASFNDDFESSNRNNSASVSIPSTIPTSPSLLQPTPYMNLSQLPFFSGQEYPRNPSASSSNTSQGLSAALKAEKEQLRKRHLDLGMSMSRRENTRKETTINQSDLAQTDITDPPLNGSVPSSVESLSRTVQALALEANFTNNRSSNLSMKNIF